jgi:hypothetical protein
MRATNMGCLHGPATEIFSSKGDGGLTIEALSGFSVLGEMRRQNLNGNRPIQSRVAGAIHFTHTG